MSAAAPEVYLLLSHQGKDGIGTEVFGSIEGAAARVRAIAEDLAPGLGDDDRAALAAATALPDAAGRLAATLRALNTDERAERGYHIEMRRLGLDGEEARRAIIYEFVGWLEGHGLLVVDEDSVPATGLTGPDHDEMVAGFTGDVLPAEYGDAAWERGRLAGERSRLRS